MSETHGTVDLWPEPRSQRCSAKRSNGEPCKRWAIVGGTVCPTHGGSAPQVRDAARRRLEALIPQAIQTLRRNLDAESEPTQVRAAAEILNRAGLVPGQELTVVPQEQSNAALDAAILDALRARGHVVPAPDALDDEVTDVTLDDLDEPEA